MIARKCNRCRAIIPDDVPQGTMQINGIGFWIHDYTGEYFKTSHCSEGDFCDDCSKEFIAFLTKYKEESE